MAQLLHIQPGAHHGDGGFRKTLSKAVDLAVRYCCSPLDVEQSSFQTVGCVCDESQCCGTTALLMCSTFSHAPKYTNKIGVVWFARRMHKSTPLSWADAEGFTYFFLFFPKTTCLFHTDIIGLHLITSIPTSLHEVHVHVTVFTSHTVLRQSLRCPISPPPEIHPTARSHHSTHSIGRHHSHHIPAY